MKEKFAVLWLLEKGEKIQYAAEMLKVLRAMGMEKVLVESPTYCHHMMREGYWMKFY